MTDAVPTIDLRPWFTGTSGERSGVAAAVDAALQRSGFMLVTGHGVDPARAEAARAEAVRAEASARHRVLPPPIGHRHHTAVLAAVRCGPGRPMRDRA
jgi:hypothetical protein